MPLKLYKRGEVWWYRGTVAKRRLHGSTQTADKDLAQQIASEVETRQWRSHLYGPASVLTFAQCVDLYLKAEKSDRYVLATLDRFKDTPIQQINGEVIKQAAREVYRHAGPATRNRQFITPAQAVINHAAELGLCPSINVRRFQVPQKEVEPVTHEWLDAFTAEAVPHLGTLAWFMFLTAARISEALNVEWDDVNLGAATVRIRMGKLGGDERTAHLQQPLVIALAKLGTDRGGLLFPYASRHSVATGWKAAIRRAGIKPLSPHACRHGFATSLLQAGVDVATVAYLGGWKTQALVLKTYAHAIKDRTITERIVAPNLHQMLLGNRESIVATTA